MEKWLPQNLHFLLKSSKTKFELSQNTTTKPVGDFKVPKIFSLVKTPNESYSFIYDVINALLNQKYSRVRINYEKCENLELSAQIYLDVMIKDFIDFLKKCESNPLTKPKISKIEGVNCFNEEVRKLLFSVGSPVIHKNEELKFDDIIPYKLKIRNRESNASPLKIAEKKEIDTTELADYVINSLKRLNKRLSSEALDDLCTVIGEVLINAEEHSSTKFRFSIGYFREFTQENSHSGLFHLLIFNFGETIYEKFKDPNCENKEMVRRMEKLSKKYTEKNLFFRQSFEEETLWTLYALQQGVTSLSDLQYKKRGNGSIQFIESFFNLKGTKKNFDNVSRMAAISGNARIYFDGTYNIQEKEKDGENFKMMTFNNSGNIEEKPDQNFVSYVPHAFSGTMISAKILLDENDFTK